MEFCIVCQKNFKPHHNFAVTIGRFQFQLSPNILTLFTYSFYSWSNKLKQWKRRNSKMRKQNELETKKLLENKENSDNMCVDTKNDLGENDDFECDSKEPNTTRQDISLIVDDDLDAIEIAMVSPDPAKGATAGLALLAANPKNQHQASILYQNMSTCICPLNQNLHTSNIHSILKHLMVFYKHQIKIRNRSQYATDFCRTILNSEVSSVFFARLATGWLKCDECNQDSKYIYNYTTKHPALQSISDFTNLLFLDRFDIISDEEKLDFICNLIKFIYKELPVIDSARKEMSRAIWRNLHFCVSAIVNGHLLKLLRKPGTEDFEKYDLDRIKQVQDASNSYLEKYNDESDDWNIVERNLFSKQVGDFYKSFGLNVENEHSRKRDHSGDSKKSEASMSSLKSETELKITNVSQNSSVKEEFKFYDIDLSDVSTKRKKTESKGLLLSHLEDHAPSLKKRKLEIMNDVVDDNFETFGYFIIPKKSSSINDSTDKLNNSSMSIENEGKQEIEKNPNRLRKGGTAEDFSKIKNINIPVDFKNSDKKLLIFNGDVNMASQGDDYFETIYNIS